MNGPRNERFQYEMKERNGSLRAAYMQDSMQDRLLPLPPPKDACRSTEMSRSQSSSREELQSFYMTIDSDCLDQRYDVSPVHYQNMNNQQVKKRKWLIRCQKTCLCFVLLLIALLSSCAASTGMVLAFFPSEIEKFWLKTTHSSTHDVHSESNNQTKALLIEMEGILGHLTENNKATQELLVTLLNNSQHGFPSCSSIKHLSATSPSGYYWVRGQSNHSALLYCHMSKPCEGEVGGWTRVASLNFRDCHVACPSGLTQKTLQNSSFCACGIGQALPGCSSLVLFLPVSVDYKKLCGRVTGYSRGILEAFGKRNDSRNVEEIYMDGISLTRGIPTKRVHIWTFAAAQNLSQCPSTKYKPPSFVGNDYFCDAADTKEDIKEYFGPLWNSLNESSNSQEWFHRELRGSTTDPLELRLCLDDDRAHKDIAVETLEIYIQ